MSGTQILLLLDEGEAAIFIFWRPSLFHPPNAGTAETPVYVSLSFSVSARDADESSAAALSPDARISGQFCFAFPAVSAVSFPAALPFIPSKRLLL